jgi:hypothetical protein
MRLRTWILLRCRPSIECCAWMRRGELKLALTKRRTRASHRQCPTPSRLHLLLLESYTLQQRHLFLLLPHTHPMMTRTTQAQSHLISLPPLYLRRKCAEASGGTAWLNPVRLKPGRKVSATSKYSHPKPREDVHGRTARTMANPNPEQPARSHHGRTRYSTSLSGLGTYCVCARMAWDCSTFLMRCVSSVCVILAPQKQPCSNLSFVRLITHEKLSSSLQRPASRGLQIPATSSPRHLLAQAHSGAFL